MLNGSIVPEPPVNHFKRRLAAVQLLRRLASSITSPVMGLPVQDRPLRPESKPALVDPLCCGLGYELSNVWDVGAGRQDAGDLRNSELRWR